MRTLISRTGLLSLAALIGLSAQAATWTLAPSESRVIFHYSYEDVPGQGEFRNVDATFDIDTANPGACNINVSIPIADIHVDSSEVKEYLLDEDMFNAEQYPMAAFQASQCRLQSVNSFVADGQLTIRDKTHPISFPFTIDMEMHNGRPRFHLTSEVTVNRLDFDVGTGWWDDTVALPNEIRIEVDVYSGQ
ncbi:MAG: YceI family protein [Pseudohongiella sp.]|nr:YceI family protein [Pseudohongiella sp.]MDO9518808.1 YceI family protein [Pseudohongiella sp.]MDP2128784.1 YceI family protein [Pseudohongiella sp.]